jgi:hypothetical protein
VYIYTATVVFHNWSRPCWKLPYAAILTTLSEIIEPSLKSGTDPDNLIYDIWETSLSVKGKIILSLELFDIQPTYHVLTTMWLAYAVANGDWTTDFNKIIYAKYRSVLSAADKGPNEGMEYSLFFDIFQSPKIQKEAWDYFLDNNPSDKFMMTMLANSAPIPYSIKDKLYQKLITNVDFHIPIYKSIRDNSTYAHGYSVELDKPKALETILSLNIKAHIPILDEETGRDTYCQILSFLSKENGR